MLGKEKNYSLFKVSEYLQATCDAETRVAVGPFLRNGEYQTLKSLRSSAYT
jgi:hypothetical protein